MFVTERFKLAEETVNLIYSMKPDMSAFGEFIFNRTYARDKPDGTKETWHDCVIRVIEGTFSIRKNHYVKNRIEWKEDFWRNYAHHMAISLFNMQWCPPGRGLFAMGTDFVYERGSAALQNCAAIKITDDVGRKVATGMDMLMCGIGVGFVPERSDDLYAYEPIGSYVHVIPDTREGWCESVQAQVESYLKGSPKPEFNYTLIRGPGLPIKGFGGLSSGPEPLKVLHKQIDDFFQRFLTDPEYDSVMLKMDIMNAIGCCVVAGNVRRSAELACGSISDPVFMDLKNYEKYPYRAAIGWMSNNSVILEDDEDFEHLGEIARRVIKNGEPGFINRQNMKYGRIGKRNDNVREDKADAFNPCGEQQLESDYGECCTLAETAPTRCINQNAWLKACEYATVYASTVTLLPTHIPDSNAVMLKNRRIGVGIMDVAGWSDTVGPNKLVKYLNEGYKHIRKINQWVNGEAGVPESIRVTTIKPGGTIPKMIGVRSGWNRSNFEYTLQRVRVAANNPICDLLNEAGVPHEPDVVSAGTEVYEFVTHTPGKTTQDISLWEQAAAVVMLQRHWSDNAVSNTLNFKPKWILESDVPSEEDDEINYDWEVGPDGKNRNQVKIEISNGRKKTYRYNTHHEENDIEAVLSFLAPLTKSISLLPQVADGVYAQMPQSGISQEEYERRLSQIKPIDWSKLKNSVTEPERYCMGDACEIKQGT